MHCIKVRVGTKYFEPQIKDVVLPKQVLKKYHNIVCTDGTVGIFPTNSQCRTVIVNIMILVFIR